MTKPIYAGANVEVNVDTFASFVNKVNWIMDDMAKTVVTVAPVPDANTSNGARSVGNAHIEGILSSVIMTPDEIRGGTIANPADLLLSSNLVPKTNTTVSIGVAANRVNAIFAVNTNITTLTANSATIASANIASANVASGSVTNLLSTNASIATLRVTGNLQVDGVTTLAANTTVAVNTSIIEYLTSNKWAYLNGNTVIGDSNTDTLLVNAVTTLAANVTPSSNAISLGSSANHFATAYVDTIGNDVSVKGLLNIGNTANSSGSIFANTTTAQVRKHDANGAVISTFAINGAANTDIKFNGATVWTADNDGSGSGLDAGLLEGSNKAFYRDASNLNAGTIGDARLPTSMAGKTFTSAVTFGSDAASANTDLTRHIALFGNTYGFGVSASNLNYVSGNNHAFYSAAGVELAKIASGGMTVAGEVVLTSNNGILSIAKGGTGGGTAADARTGLSVYSKAEIDAALLSNGRRNLTVSSAAPSGGSPGDIWYQLA